MRYVVLLFLFTLSIAPAHAGFEWIPPTESGVRLGEKITNQTRDEALTPDWQDNAPSQTNRVSPVESVPLSNNEPTSLFPASRQERIQQQRIAAMPTKNLSGRKLVIDPYPLRKGQLLAPIQSTEASKAMQEGAKNLHPVKLGGGFSTGAKPKSIPFPKTSKEAFTSKPYTPRIPSINKGLTPMMDKEVATLPMENASVIRKPKRIKLNPKPLSKNTMPQNSMPQNAPQQYVQAIGFGQDLPMAMALSQIIPAGFTHSFAKDVDTGLSVSWEGGKAWNMVLNDMLRPHKLTAIIQDNKVTIQPMAAL